MLVITRKTSEEVIIGGVRLKVIDAGNGRCRLGFSGPRDVLICRGEVLEDRQVITMHDYVEKRRLKKAG